MAASLIDHPGRAAPPIPQASPSLTLLDESNCRKYRLFERGVVIEVVHWQAARGQDQANLLSWFVFTSQSRFRSYQELQWAA